MEINLEPNTVAFLRSVLPAIFPNSTRYLNSDISVLDEEMQDSWRENLADESDTDARAVLTLLERQTGDALDLTDDEAEALLRSLSGVRLYLANTALADLNIEELEQVFQEALLAGNAEVVQVIRIYFTLSHIESRILDALGGEG